MDVCIDWKGRDPKSLGHHNAGCLMSYSWKCLKGLEAFRYSPVMLAQQQFLKTTNVFGFCLCQAELSDQAPNFRFINGCHCFRCWPCSKECRCDFIHLFVCALSTQQNSDQKRERIGVVKGNGCFWVAMIESLQHNLSPLGFAQGVAASQMAT